MTRACIVVLALFASLPSRASAFRLAETYAQPAIDGGGGERWFTGSSSDGHSCAVCHRGAEAPEAEIRGLPELGYVPGETYEIEVPLPPTTTASATLEFVDAIGAGAGALALPTPSAPDLCASVGGAPPEPAASTASTRKGRQIAVVDGCGADRLFVRWTPPADARGPIWVHAAIVGADGEGDPEGDGVRVLTAIVPSYGGPGEVIRVGSPACSTSASRTDATPLWLIVLTALWIWRRRHSMPRVSRS